jgi:uncharacterized protein involved in exopolysaccharide biosynthesis
MAVEDFEDQDQFGLPPFVWDPLGVVRRRWRWMLATLLVGLIGTALYGLSLKPRFKAAAIVMIATKEMPEDFVRSTVEEDPFERISAMVGEILARPRLAALIEKHDLFPEEREFTEMGALVDRVRRNILIEPEKGLTKAQRFETARLLSVGFASNRPDTAAAIANDIASLLAEAGIRLRSQQASLTTEFMRRELTRAERELRDHDQEITEFNTRYRGELPVDLEPSLRELARLQQQRESLALQIAETESRLAVLSTGDISPDARLLQLRAALTQELAVHTEKHPNVISLRRQIAGLEREIAEIDAGDTENEQLSNTPLAASRRTLEELNRQRGVADARILDLEARVARIPQRREQLEALEEKESVLQATYTDFLRKVQEAELAQTLEQAQQGARISVIERAEPPLRPTRSRSKLLGVGVFASLLAACGVGVLFEIIDPVLLMSSDAHAVEDIPILGSVPWIT